MEEPRRLGGRYELGRVLGRGGMAEVHLAHDTRLGRTVAVKTLRADLARDPSFQARFRREAQSAASLNHPAIVAVYDTDEGEVDGVPLPYIVMERVEGCTLRELLRSGQQLRPGQVLEMTAGILQGLEYAHRAGIVHRDIKPANVMLTRDGQVKVMDFGIARAMDGTGITLTEASAVVGTAQYLSPEQAKGEQVDARSDLYSTGCLLYELLTQSPPFGGASPVTVAYHHVHEEPKAPSALNPEITPDMDAIVLRALLKDPGHRYQSADEMRADIEACLRGRSVAATAALGVVGTDPARPAVPTAAPEPRSGPAEPTVTLPPVVPHDGSHGSDDRFDRRPPRTSRTVVVAMLMAGILAVSAVFFNRWAIDDGDSNGGGRGGGGDSIVAGDAVVMPDFVGETRTAAERLAQEHGLRLAFEQKPCATQSNGRICEQDPATGTTVTKGSTVNVVAATGRAESSRGGPESSRGGPESKVTVPRVTGLSIEDAKAKLEGDRYAFDVRTETRESGEDPGTVLKQDPSAGTEVEKGTTITLVVAGKPGEHGAEQGDVMATVPDVTGLTCDEAKSRMRVNALVGHCTEQGTDDPDRAGKVISTAPGANQQVERNSRVTIVVGKAGQREELVPVPDVGGESLSTARVLLREAGLTVGDISGSEHPLARVVFSGPSEGTRVERGTAVDLATVGPNSKDDE
ncbi:Stk1 family PASTA domain-containing Ser/Thr kinase [Streptomyces massasporeus]|uniref:Stk1 family PASTA domain-containing Ser/Thr kinase n=1 Tax=Streptomyces massasporeus TaxID=67324 RepID=UPI003456DD29